MADIFHLSALEVRLSHERDYLARSRTDDERNFRRVWIAQIEREISNEKAFLGISEIGSVAMSDDDLLSALSEKGADR